MCLGLNIDNLVKKTSNFDFPSQHQNTNLTNDTGIII